MKNLIPQFSEFRKNLESAAFFVSRGNCEKDAHAKIVRCLVLLSQLEQQIIQRKENGSFKKSGGLLTRNTKQSGEPQISPIDGEENKISNEIKKVSRRVPRWRSNPNQYNSTILSKFLELSKEQPEVTVQSLRSNCHLLSDFDGNYNQMKNFGDKNHGKVFEESNGLITLWEPVKKIILDLYNKDNTRLHVK